MGTRGLIMVVKDGETKVAQYAGKESNGGTTYYPVVLKAEWQLDNLPSNNEFINKLNPPDEDEEQDVPEDKNFMKDKVTYLLVKVDTDQDIETIVGHIETLENNISPLTRLDVTDTRTFSKDSIGDAEKPVIYFP